MNKLSLNEVQQPKLTGEELLEGMMPGGKYEHLRIILYKNSNTRHFGQHYLMVTPNGFGVVRLHDIDFDNNRIQLDLEDVSTGIAESVSLDVNDKEFKFVLLSWGDVINLDKDVNKYNFDTCETLELEL